MRLRSAELLWALFLTSIAGAETLRFRSGKVYDNERCRAAPQYHYNLYVPSGYKSGTPTPVLFVFSPTGNAGVELFRPGAESLGWLVCASIESRNGQKWSFYKDLCEALRQEMAENFTVHPRRKYYSGMSGGCRVSYEMLWRYSRDGAGVIGMAAAMGRLNVPSVPGIACVGIVGRRDFNYWEVLELKHKFDRQKMAFRLIEWNGSHTWAPENLVTDAMEWLEYQHYLRSPHLNDDERARRPQALAGYLKYIASMKTGLDAYESCEDLLEVLEADDPVRARVSEMLEAARPKLSGELKAREQVVGMILVGIKKGGADYLGQPILKRADQLAIRYAGTVYGQRSAAFAKSLSGKLKRSPPPRRFGGEEGPEKE